MLRRSLRRRLSVLVVVVAVRVEQLVRVDDEVAHVGVVDGLLRLGQPGAAGVLVGRIGADEVDLGEVLELGRAVPAI